MNSKQYGQSVAKLWDALTAPVVWTVVADGQETGVYTDNYSTALALAEEYETHSEVVQIVEVN